MYRITYLNHCLVCGHRAPAIAALKQCPRCLCLLAKPSPASKPGASWLLPVFTP